MNITVSAKVHRAIVVVVSILTVLATYMSTSGHLLGISPDVAISVGSGLNLVVTMLRQISDAPVDSTVAPVVPDVPTPPASPTKPEAGAP